MINSGCYLNINAEGIRELNLLGKYPLRLECNGYSIAVPEPEAYIIQKLIINPTRKPNDKKEKDIQAVRQLMGYVDNSKVRKIYNNLSKKEKQIVDTISKENYIDIWGC